MLLIFPSLTFSNPLCAFVLNINPIRLNTSFISKGISVYTTSFSIIFRYTLISSLSKNTCKDSTATNIERRKIPIRHENIQNILPKFVVGVYSPYPTVDIVMKVSHRVFHTYKKGFSLSFRSKYSNALNSKAKIKRWK